MSIGIKLKKGLDLHLQGGVTEGAEAAPRAVKTPTVAIVPDDYLGLTPKMEVREGDTVAAGQPLYHGKTAEPVKVVSPASGTVKAVVRGERRKIERIVIEVVADGPKHPIDTAKASATEADARAFLQHSGLWAMTRQRPYDIVPTHDAAIRDVFVSGFDTAPLAVTPRSYDAAAIKALEAGVKVLGVLTRGKVYVTRCQCQQLPDLTGAEMVDVEGPHPAGNVGPVISAVKPVNKGETVMTLRLETLARIGRTLLEGAVPMDTLVAVTGSEVKKPYMASTLIGAEVQALLADDVKDDGHHHRIISGNVLTGVKVTADGYLRYPYTQLTVIPEGDDRDEFMGWASMSPEKMSTSRSFIGHFLRYKRFNPDARLLGGRRAMILSGQMDAVTPMDILPEYLIKAILAKDIDRMEQLGIYEVAPEDFALAEYADASKMELQKIVRQGLDYLRKELE